jgi:hypothetical protein
MKKPQVERLLDTMKILEEISDKVWFVLEHICCKIDVSKVINSVTGSAYDEELGDHEAHKLFSWR